ncbi:hypothetical protein SAMN05421806_1011254 [Streptomyces indicus]|uniref:Uncharacterized protein n=2 Tax=Streptomyces indicus TaxID=417292 RepID=A0A1G8V4P9_9ACTN|nr:hypothetical protein SAMN05421806_1011254 [Streptomyces indicus]
MTAYRRVSAVAVAALLISGVTAPAALAATPDRAPAASVVAPSPNTALVGAGLTLDLDALLDLEAHGLVAVGIGGAVAVDGEVSLKVGRGSVLTHKNKQIVGGKVLLQGGVELRKGAKKVRVTNLAVDIRTGAITAKVGAKANVRLGAVVKADEVHAELHEGTSKATLSLATDGIALNAAAFADLGTQLGTCIEIDTDTVIDAALDVDLDLAVGAVVDVDLVAALGLDVALDLDLDLGLDLDAILDLDADVDLGLNLGIL